MTERISFARAVATTTIMALVATFMITTPTAQAASTGIDVNTTLLEMAPDVRANFGVTALTDDGTASEGTTVVVTDNGSNGAFFSGNFSAGTCSDSASEVTDGVFSIGKTKGICYSNATAGDYEITVSLLSSTSDLIGEEVTIDVSVETEEADVAQDPVLLALIDDLMNQVADLQSQTGNTDPVPSPDGDDTNEDLQAIVTALQEQIVTLQAELDAAEDDAEAAEKERLFGYLSAALFGIPGTLELDILHEGEVVGSATVTFNDDRDDVTDFTFDFTDAFKALTGFVSADDVDVDFSNPDVSFYFASGGETDVDFDYDSFNLNIFGGSQLLFETNFDGSEDYLLAFRVAAESEEDNGEDDSNGDSDDHVADKCEFEGHKYNEEGTPLEGWEMGLIKVITYQGQTYVYTISTDVTDADGFYCLRWSDVWTPAYDANDFPGGYEFEYRIYENNQPDWEFVSAEHGLDFNNLAVTTLDLLTFTETQVQHMVGEPNGYVYTDAEYHVDFYNKYTGSSTDNGGGNGGDDDFTPLTLVSVCRVTDGGMTFDVSNSNADAIDATYEVVGTGDTATVTIAAAGVTTFTTATATAAGTTTLDYTVASSSYSTSTVAVDTVCDPINIGGGGGNGGNDDDDNDGGGSSSGTRVGDRNGSGGSSTAPTPTVAGISDVNPQPTVAGDQVSLIPVGGANGGAGGTATTLPSIVALMLVAGIALTLQARRFLNA